MFRVLESAGPERNFKLTNKKRKLNAVKPPITPPPDLPLTKPRGEVGGVYAAHPYALRSARTMLCRPTIHLVCNLIQCFAFGSQVSKELKVTKIKS